MLFKNKLFNNISWIKTHKLVDVLYNQQIYLNIEKQYHFSFCQQPEEENLNKILNLFKKEIIDDYFNKRLNISLKLLRLSETEYFMYMFRYFLLTNQLDKHRLFLREYRIEMYDKKLLCYNENGCEDWIYALTDFSITYHKLLFTVQTYCESNENIKKLIPALANFNNSDKIKEILDKKELDIIKR